MVVGICKNCLIWQNHLEDNKHQQLEAVSGLARIGFPNVKCVSNLYRILGRVFRQLISIMDDECPSGRCKVLGGKG